MLLLIGVKEDPTLKYLVEYLKKRGVSYCFHDQSKLDHEIHVDNHAIDDQSISLPIDQFGGIYNRATGLNPNNGYTYYQYAHMSLPYQIVDGSDINVAN